MNTFVGFIYRVNGTLEYSQLVFNIALTHSVWQSTTKIGRPYIGGFLVDTKSGLKENRTHNIVMLWRFGDIPRAPLRISPELRHLRSLSVAATATSGTRYKLVKNHIASLSVAEIVPQLQPSLTWFPIAS